MLQNPLGIHQDDIVSWKYLICAGLAAVLGVAVVGERLVHTPATSTVQHKGDAGRTLVEAVAVQPSSMAATELPGRQEEAAGSAVQPTTPVATSEPLGQQEAGAKKAAQGEVDQLMASLDQALERNPRDATALRNRAKAWEAKGEADRALADYEAAIRLAPDDPAAFRGRGGLWRRLGDFDRALLDLDRAVRFTFADAENYCDRGLVWNQKGDHDRAIADFSHALKLDPRRACAYVGRGLALLGKGESARARADFNEATLIDPNLRDVIARAIAESRMLVGEDSDGAKCAAAATCTAREVSP
jgi:tetratricopeptide (TPR) repeat protein